MIYMDCQLWECMNSGLDYWNSGIVDWEVFALIFHFSNYCG